MKSNFTILITLIALSLNSCIDDFVGGGTNDQEIVLTENNYLDSGSLEKIFITDEITFIDEEISKLKTISPNNSDYENAQKQIIALENKRAEFKNSIAEIVDLSSVGLNFPIPCDNPSGKCIPSRLEFFTFLKDNTFAAEVSLKDDTGNTIGSSAKLIDLPGYEDKIQYIRIPIKNNYDNLSVEIAKKDSNGNEIMFIVQLKN